MRGQFWMRRRILKGNEDESGWEERNDEKNRKGKGRTGEGREEEYNIEYNI